MEAVLGTRALDDVSFAYPDDGEEEAAIAATGLGVYLTDTGSTARDHGLVLGEQLFPSETVLLENAHERTETTERVASCSRNRRHSAAVDRFRDAAANEIRGDADGHDDPRDESRGDHWRGQPGRASTLPKPPATTSTVRVRARGSSHGVGSIAAAIAPDPRSNPATAPAPPVVQQRDPQPDGQCGTERVRFRPCDCRDQHRHAEHRTAGQHRSEGDGRDGRRWRTDVADVNSAPGTKPSNIAPDSTAARPMAVPTTTRPFVTGSAS